VNEIETGPVESATSPTINSNMPIRIVPNTRRLMIGDTAKKPLCFRTVIRSTRKPLTLSPGEFF
jgi:hypothetical protein